MYNFRESCSFLIKAEWLLMVDWFVEMRTLVVKQTCLGNKQRVHNILVHV
jgi:hypothetical protein